MSEYKGYDGKAPLRRKYQEEHKAEGTCQLCDQPGAIREKRTRNEAGEVEVTQVRRTRCEEHLRQDAIYARERREGRARGRRVSVFKVQKAPKGRKGAAVKVSGKGGKAAVARLKASVGKPAKVAKVAAKGKRSKR